MFTVYILKSKKKEKYYIGFTSNLEKRLKQHNAGLNKSTVYGRPWVIVRQESFDTKIEALNREKQIKSYKGGRAFKALLESGI